MKKIQQLIIIGASGFIGGHLFDLCKKEQIHVIGTYFRNPADKEMVHFDIQNNTFFELLNSLPDRVDRERLAVVLCSANTSIDGCRDNESSSYDLNVASTKRLLDELEQMKIKTVFLSSEAVFDGERGFYTEDDEPNPVTVYGMQKYEIEKYVLSSMPDAIVFRISRAAGSNFGEKDIFHEFYTKIEKQQKIVCLKDQSFCLTEVNDIAKGILCGIDRDLRGVYHLSSRNYISRYELACLFSDVILEEKEKI